MKALTHSSIYAAGTILRQLAGFIMLPIYTRHLSPEDYGTVGFIIFFIGIMEIFLGARLVQSVHKYYHETDNIDIQNNLVSTALLTTAAISIVSNGILIAFADLIAETFLGGTQNTTIFILLSFTLTTLAIEGYGLTYLRLQDKAIAFVAISLIKLIVQLSINVWLVVYLETGVLGVAISSAVSNILFAIALGIYVLKNTGINFTFITSKKLMLFCWPLWVGSIAGIYIGSSNRYFIQEFSSLNDLGLFELAVKFSAILSMLFWQPFAQYWEVEQFKIYKANPNSQVFNTALRGISTLLILASSGISIFSPLIIELMSAPSFHKAQSAVPFLTGAAFFSCLTIFCNFSFLVSSQTKKISQNLYATAIVLSILFFICIPRWGFVGAAAAMLGTEAFRFILTFIRAKKAANIHLKLSYSLTLFAAAATAVIATSYTTREHNQASIEAFGFNTLTLTILSIIIIAYYFTDSTSRKVFIDMLKNNKKGKT